MLENILCFIIGTIIGILYYYKENRIKCYKDIGNNTSKTCTGEGCNYKFSCKLYKNYLEDE